MSAKKILGVLLILAGFAFWVSLYSYSRNYLAAENQIRILWPTVKGTTLSTKISVEGPIPLISEEAKDYLAVEFGYEVEGVGYRGKQKWVLGDSLDPGTHPPAGYSGSGKTVIVYYNPTNPADAPLPRRRYAERHHRRHHHGFGSSPSQDCVHLCSSSPKALNSSSSPVASTPSARRARK